MQKGLVKFTKGQAFLLAKLGNIQDGVNNLVFGDGQYFIRKDIGKGSSGIIEVLLDSDDIVSGVCNISKRKLPDFVNLALERIEFGWAPADAGTVGSATYKELTSSTTDKALLNSEIEMLINDKSVLKVPLKNLQEDLPLVNGSKCGINLQAPKLITPKDKIQIRLHVPNGTTYTNGATNNFIEVVLRGCSTEIK